MAQDAIDVRILHAVIDSAGGLQAACRLKQVDVPFGGDIGQQPATHRGMWLGPGDLDVEVAGDLLEIECRRTGGVGVAVAADRLPTFRAFERGEHLAATAPVRHARAFQVRDHHRHARVAADAKGFVHRVQNLGELAAQVGGVDRACLGQRFGQRQHFIGGSVECVGICQAGGKPKRTMIQGFLKLAAHCGGLGLGRGPVQPIHMIAAQRGMADQCGHVHGWLRGVDGSHVRFEVGVAKGVGAAQQVHRVGWITGQRDGRGADAAVSDDHGGHALGDLRGHRGLTHDIGVVVRMDIDEPGGEHQTVTLHDVRRRIGVDRAWLIDAGDAAIANCHVGQARRGARAIKQQHAADQGIEQVWHRQSPSGWRLSGPSLSWLMPRWASSTYFSRRSFSLLCSCCSSAKRVASTSSTISIA